MTQQQRKRPPILTTPKGIFKFPKLNKPDYGSRDYPCPEGKYEVKLILRADAPETKAFIAKLMPFYEEAMAEAKEKFSALKIETRKKLGKVTENDLFTTLYDSETEEPTGEIEFKFGMTASGIANKGKDNERKWTSKPELFDARGNKMIEAPDIWSGTVGRISFSPRAYFINGTAAAGLKLALVGAQVIELRQGGARSAQEHGFGAEDGYEYNPDAGRNGFEDETDGSGQGGGSDMDDEIPF